MIGVLCIAAVQTSGKSDQIIYVDDDAQVSGDGSSWERACPFLQDALTTAKSLSAPVVIRVAQGVYRPNQGLLPLVAPSTGIGRGGQPYSYPGEWPADRGRQATFGLVNGVTLKGGYAGAGAPDPNARDVARYETILSGDLAGDDVVVSDPSDLPNEPTRADNSYTVVTASGIDATAVLDGVAITAGQHVAEYDEYGGAGMFSSGSSPMVIDCRFLGNSAFAGGGGMMNVSSSPRLIRCSFTGNYAGAGGAISNASNLYTKVPSNPVLVACAFSGNYARSYGGAISSGRGDCKMRDCTFLDNRTLGLGGGIYRGGNLTDCTFSGNVAGQGGAINSGSANLALAGCTFRDNEAVGEHAAGGAIWSEGAESIVAARCVFSGNSSGIGGAIRSRFSQITLSECAFERNVAFEGYFGGKGGGLWLLGSGQIGRCIFRFNEASEGGALYNHQGAVAVTECRFIGNSAVTAGGAIYGYRTPSSFALGNSLFGGNLAEYGGGVFLTGYSRLDLASCTFAGNLASVGSAVAYDPDAATIVPGLVTLVNSILWDGYNGLFAPEPGVSAFTITHSNVQGAWPGEGNINLDPLFAAPGYWDPNGTADDPNDDYWVEGDYHLKSQAGRWNPAGGSWTIDDVTSPCIDAGDPNGPIGLEPFPNGGRINMGAYGGTAEASKSYFGEPLCETIIAGDINGDCKVDLLDLLILLQNWCEEPVQ
jgi:predicted outer membrane repeat protein